MDVSLFDAESGRLLDMGTNYTAKTEKVAMGSTEITSLQRANREMLARALVGVGFTNFPGEWWHFMFGEQEWAAYEGHPYCYYGGLDD